MAPLTRSRKAALDAAAPAIDPADRLSKLPDEVLALILSLLPAQAAVQTCMLGRTWRDVWKMATRLLITGDSIDEVGEFVDHLLRIRLDGLKLAPLDACEIELYVDGDDERRYDICLDTEDTSRVNSWIHRVLKCEVQSLRVDLLGNILEQPPENFFKMSERSLVSRYLVRLEILGGVTFKDDERLNLSGCPALEHLEMTHSWVPDVVTSPSLKHLVITACYGCLGVYICAPRLVSLWLEDLIEWTPLLLESMPDLVRARVEIGSETDDFYDFDLDDAKCYNLQGVAAAKHLEMIVSCNSMSSTPDIFLRDMRWCPTFSNLKTLVLDHGLCESETSETADCTLACILEHAPLLEKLTVIFEFRIKYKVEVKGHLDETFKSATISQHLKIVVVKCEIVDEKVLNILKFFGALNICFQITVT